GLAELAQLLREDDGIDDALSGVVDRPGRDGADEAAAMVVVLAANAEQPLDLAHQTLVRRLELARVRVADLLALHPHADVRDVPIEQVAVLGLVDQAARRPQLLLDRVEQARPDDLSEKAMIVVAARELLFFEPLVFGRPFAELVELAEHG